MLMCITCEQNRNGNIFNMPPKINDNFKMHTKIRYKPLFKPMTNEEAVQDMFQDDKLRYHIAKRASYPKNGLLKLTNQSIKLHLPIL